MKWFASALFVALLAYALRPLSTEDHHSSGGAISLIAPQPAKTEQNVARTYILPLASMPGQSHEFDGERLATTLSAELLRGELRIHLARTERGDIRVSVDSQHLRLDEQATYSPPRLIVRCELAEDEWGEDIVQDALGADPQQLAFLLSLDIQVEEIFFRRHEIAAYWALSLDLATSQLRIEQPDGSLSAPLASFDD